MKRVIHFVTLMLSCLFIVHAQAVEVKDVDGNILPYYENNTFTGDLDEIKQRKVIRALVTYSRTDFFIHNGHFKGMQFELLKRYEETLNKGVKKEVDKVRIKYVPVRFDQLIPSLEQGHGDIAAAFLSITPHRQRRVAFATSLATSVDEILVTDKTIEKVSGFHDLSGLDITVLKGSSYIEHLNTINRILTKQGRLPINVIEADKNLLSEDILEMVNAGIVKATLIDDYKAELWSQVFDNIVVHKEMPISINNYVGWAVRQNNPQLKASLTQFVEAQAKQGTLVGNSLFKTYYENTQWIKAADVQGQRDKLRKLAPIFQKYADKYDYDPIALAAQGYQESTLNNNAVSHRGAVGIMQIMPSTAKEMGIKNFRQLEPNIATAAKYVAWLKRHFVNDPGIKEGEDLPLIWAAYNAGPGNFAKMQKRAEEMGLDKNVWFGNMEIAAGMQTGRETVQYVANVYKYYLAYTLSQQIEQQKADAIATKQPEDS